ncbi:MAG: hypothetical protein WCQ50_21805 [Spirochaetota bacterium]
MSFFRNIAKTSCIAEIHGGYDSDLRFFVGTRSPESTLQRIFLEKKTQRRGQTLLFIDEIQQALPRRAKASPGSLIFQSYHYSFSVIELIDSPSVMAFVRIYAIIESE